MTTPTDRPNLDRLQELDKAATPGPWEACEDGLVWRTDLVPGDPASASTEPDDAALIAAYRNATPALVAALTDVLAYAAQLDRQPMGDLIADEIRDCLTAHLDLTNGA